MLEKWLECLSLILNCKLSWIGDWIRDGFCDDSNNKDACDYDGGDCCGLSARKKFCIDCTCKGKLSSSQLLKETWSIFTPSIYV